jgi:hypothetical protein
MNIRDPTIFGCIAIILSVGIGPLAQQEIKAVPCSLLLDSSKPTITIAG